MKKLLIGAGTLTIIYTSYKIGKVVGCYESAKMFGELLGKNNIDVRNLK